jgi:hypothetical protein
VTAYGDVQASLSHLQPTSVMTSLPSVPSLYEPTAEEEAYGIYIFDKLFGTFPVDGLIHVEANVGLRVLESSGVSGIILRTIWSVADPDNLRCLTYLSQFHVVLRLIALAQDGLLEKEINRAFTQQRNNTTPVAVIQRTLWMSTDYRDCPLPKFEGVPMPTREFLTGLSNRLRKISDIAPRVPAPAPLRRNPAPAPAPIPIPINSRGHPDTVNAVAPAPSPKAKARGQPDTINAVAPDTIPDLIKVKSNPPGIGHPDTVNAVAPDRIPNVVTVKNSPTGIGYQIQRIESLGVDSVSISVNVPSLLGFPISYV